MLLIKVAQLGMEAHACNPKSQLLGSGGRRSGIHSQPKLYETLSQKRVVDIVYLVLMPHPTEAF